MQPFHGTLAGQVDGALPASVGVEAGQNMVDGFLLCGKEMIASNDFRIAASFQHPHHIRLDFAQVQIASLCLAALGFPGQHFRTGHVHEIDAASHHQYIAFVDQPFVDVVQVFGHMVDRPEKERAVNADDLKVVAFRVRFNQRWSGFVRIVCHVGDAGVSGTVQVQDQGKQHPGINGKFQIQEKGRQKGGQHHRRFFATGPYDGPDVVQIDEIVGHQQDDAPHGGDGQIGGQRRYEQQQQGQQEG